MMSLSYRIGLLHRGRTAFNVCVSRAMLQEVAGAKAMASDAPPPYSAVAETKIDPATLQPTAPVSFVPQVTHQTLPPTQAPSAPSGYETVSYYPAPGVSDNAPVSLQPQPQVILIQSPQVVVVPGGVGGGQAPIIVPQQPIRPSFASHICLACCSIFCCFSCPLSLTAFILARKCFIGLRSVQTSLRLNFKCHKLVKLRQHFLHVY